MSANFEKYVYAAYLQMLRKADYETLTEEQQEFVRQCAYEEISEITGLSEWHIVSIIQNEEFANEFGA